MSVDKPPKIGRGAVVVDDPFDRYLLVLDKDADAVDKVATANAPQYDGMSLDDLAELREALEASLLGTPFDRASLENPRAARGRSEEGLLRRQEEYHVVVGRGILDGRDDSEQQERIREARSEVAAAELDLIVGSREDLRPALETHGHVLASLVAVEREEAIAKERERLQHEGVATDLHPPPAGVRQIGTAEEALLAERGVAESDWGSGVASGDAVRVGRDEVSKPTLLGEDYELLPKARHDQLTAMAFPLADWLAGQPDHYVAKRHRELGPPEPPPIDRRNARLLAHIEAMTKKHNEIAEVAAERAARFADDGDHVKSVAEGRKADEALVKVSNYTAIRNRAEYQDLDLPTPIEMGDGLQQQVFNREDRIRKLMDAEFGARVSVRLPSEALVERLGEPPAVGAPERAEWEELAHDLEFHRLDAAGANAAGVAPREPLYDLEQRVTEYRVAQGLEQPTLAAQIDAAGPALE